MLKKIALVAVTIVSSLAIALAAQQVTKEPVEGVVNFARLETTVACGGATKPEAVPALKKMGFVSIINLREATEPGANVDAEAAAAKAVGMKFFHVPFNGNAPDPKAVDQFLDAITSPGAEPAFIHCAGGNRLKQSCHTSSGVAFGLASRWTFGRPLSAIQAACRVSR